MGRAHEGSRTHVPARAGWRATAVAVGLGVAACTPHPVGPARTFDDFEAKAVTTAESARSAVESVQLVARTADAGKAFGPYTSVLVSDQEDALAGVQGTFGSIQPPDEQADRLRTDLDDLLTTALQHVTAVRVAARRGQLDGLASVASALGRDSESLEHFIEEHSA